jgi:hypothetical protein
MAEHPIYPGDASMPMTERPCAARDDEGSCEDAARQIGVTPGSSWTTGPAAGRFGWVCSAHFNVLTEKYDPERHAADLAQLAREGREFWRDYGIESGETPRVSHQELARESLNSDT